MTSTYTPASPDISKRSLQNGIRDQCTLSAWLNCENDSLSPLSKPLHHPEPADIITIGNTPYVIDRHDDTLHAMRDDDGHDIEEDNMDTIVKDMVSRSVQVFDREVSSRPKLHDKVSNSVTTPEEAATEALDIMVANLYNHPMSASTHKRRPASRRSQEYDSFNTDLYSGSEHAKSAFDNPASTFDELPQRLYEFGNKFLLDSQRRRLSEDNEDHHWNIKTRLARRLTEYIEMDSSFFYSDKDRKGDISPAADKTTVPDLGFDSKRVNQCIYFHFLKTDLSKGCFKAVDRYLLAANNGFSRVAIIDTEIKQDAVEDEILVSEMIANYMDKLEESASAIEVERKTMFPIAMDHFMIPIPLLLLVLLVSIAAVTAIFKCMHSNCMFLIFGFLLCINTMFYGWFALLVSLPILFLWNFVKIHQSDDRCEEDEGDYDDEESLESMDDIRFEGLVEEVNVDEIFHHWKVTV